MNSGFGRAGFLLRNVVVGLVLAVGLATLQAQEPATEDLVKLPAVSATDAHAALASAGRWVHLRKFGGLLLWDSEDVDVNSIRVVQNEIRFDAKVKNSIRPMHIPFNGMDAFGATCNDTICDLTTGSTNKLSVILDENQKSNYALIFGTNGGGGGVQKKLCARAGQADFDACQHSAALFAAALNALIRSPLSHGLDAAAFHQKAAEWRALAIKPPISQDVRIRRSLAEDAIKNNKPEEALKYYEEGLGIDPTWAQGWYNAAVVAGQLGFYADAVDHMKNYLQLVPDAADAQSAQDQIGVWQYKAGKTAQK